MGIFDQVAKQVRANLRSSAKADPDQHQQLAKELKANEEQQRQIIQQISDQATQGRPRLTALDDMLDRLEDRRADLQRQLSAKEPTEGQDFEKRIRKIQSEVTPESVELIINAAWYVMREHADNETKQPFEASRVSREAGCGRACE
jgi:acyl carrier protein phosphodiesterase